MAGTGGRQVTGENGKNPSDRKVCYVMVMEGFGLRDNCRIIAVTFNFLIAGFCAEIPRGGSSANKIDRVTLLTTFT